jgi:hypothetical protein
MTNYYADAEDLISDENSSVEIKNICNIFVVLQKER